MYTRDGVSVLETLVLRLFRLLARIHKNYKFVFVLDTETDSSLFSPGYWSGAAEVSIPIRNLRST